MRGLRVICNFSNKERNKLSGLRLYFKYQEQYSKCRDFWKQVPWVMRRTAWWRCCPTSGSAESFPLLFRKDSLPPSCEKALCNMHLSKIYLQCISKEPETMWVSGDRLLNNRTFCGSHNLASETRNQMK